MSGDGYKIVLPPGVSISAGRETVQTNAAGMAIQGMLFTVGLPSGTTTSVFIPYNLMTNRAEIARIIAERVDGINSVLNLGG